MQSNYHNTTPLTGQQLPPPQLISVIIPVYNITKCKKKFNAAINSVLSQSYSNIELIIVNDGSTDDSWGIISQLTDSRILKINKPNGGVESARRKGIQQAHGDFIIHMDQDDIYHKDAIKIMHNNATETNADVVVANSVRFILNTKLTFGNRVPNSMKQAKVIDHETFIQQYYKSFFGINDFPVNIWNKLYRTSFLKQCPEPPLTGQIIEDLSYNMHILPYAKRISIIPDTLYFYRWGGFTNHYDKTILDTAMVGYRYKNKLIEQFNLHQFSHSTSIELLNYINSHFYNIVYYEGLDTSAFIRQAQKICRTPEVLKSIENVKKADSYHNPHIDAILNHDYMTLYNVEKEYIHKNRWRNRIKNILLKL